MVGSSLSFAMVSTLRAQNWRHVIKTVMIVSSLSKSKDGVKRNATLTFRSDVLTEGCIRHDCDRRDVTQRDISGSCLVHVVSDRVWMGEKQDKDW